MGLGLRGLVVVVDEGVVVVGLDVGLEVGDPVEVDEVGPSLRYATAKVNRTQRGGGQGGFGGQGGQGGQGGYGGSAPADDPWASGPTAAPSQTPRPAADSGWGGAPSYDEPPF